MGIKTETLGFIHQSLFAIDHSLQFMGKYMVELGDQKLNERVALSISGERVWAKDYFEAMGFHHYCIDLHGMNGSFAVDLSEPITDRFWRSHKFDVLTNLGTSEHVNDQRECWTNIDMLVKKGGAFIHVVPESGQLPNHSQFYYTDQFFKCLATLNNYHILFNTCLQTVGCRAVCMVKMGNGQFVWSATGLELS